MPKPMPSIPVEPADPLRVAESCGNSALWASSLLLAVPSVLVPPPALPQLPWLCQALLAYLCVQRGRKGSDFPFGFTGDHLDHFSVHEAVMLYGIQPSMSQKEPPQSSTQGPGSLRSSIAGWTFSSCIPLGLCQETPALIM